MQVIPFSPTCKEGDASSNEVLYGPAHQPMWGDNSTSAFDVFANKSGSNLLRSADIERMINETRIQPMGYDGNVNAHMQEASMTFSDMLELLSTPSGHNPVVADSVLGRIPSDTNAAEEHEEFSRMMSEIIKMPDPLRVLTSTELIAMMQLGCSDVTLHNIERPDNASKTTIISSSSIKNNKYVLVWDAGDFIREHDINTRLRAALCSSTSEPIIEELEKLDSMSAKALLLADKVGPLIHGFTSAMLDDSVDPCSLVTAFWEYLIARCSGNDSKERIIKTLIAQRKKGRGDGRSILVQWLGCSHEYNTWMAMRAVERRIGKPVDLSQLLHV